MDNIINIIDEGALKKSIVNELNFMTICSNENKNNYSTKIFKYFEYSNEFAIVMELCDDNLSKILRRREKGFEPEEIKKIMNQLNETFKIMTKEKIVHRDIKLENILVKYENDKKEDFIVKLTDYGVSKQLSSNTTIKTIIGTKYTMAPEILEGLKYNNKCDLWSIGVIMYQLAFKEFPYTGQTDVVLLKNIKEFKHEKLKKSGDVYLDDLIRKLLEYNVKKRIDWDHYFNHAFFSSKQKKSEKIEENVVYIMEDIKEALPCKVVFVGESGRDKNGLIKHFMSDRSSLWGQSTPEISFTVKTMYFKEEKKSIKFELWNSAGEENYRSLAKIFYKNANVIVLVYDITNRKSFEELKKYWIKEIKDKALPNVSKIISFLKYIYTI